MFYDNVDVSDVQKSQLITNNIGHKLQQILDNISNKNNNIPLEKTIIANNAITYPVRNLSSADAFQKTKCIHGFRRFRIKYLEKHLSQYANDGKPSQAIEKIISYRCAKELQSLQEELNNPNGNIETIKNCIQKIKTTIDQFKSSITIESDRSAIYGYIDAF